MTHSSPSPITDLPTLIHKLDLARKQSDISGQITLAAFTVDPEAMGGREEIEEKIDHSEFGRVRVDWDSWTELVVRFTPGPVHGVAQGEFAELIRRSFEAAGLHRLIAPFSNVGTSSRLLESLDALWLMRTFFRRRRDA
jgi:hypothetical protein